MNYLRDKLEEDRVKAIEKSFNILVEVGTENWSQNYTLSQKDKLIQLEVMRKHFQELEEYEKCQYILDIKNSLNSYRYML